MYVQKRFLENILGAIVSMVARHALTIPDLECHDKRNSFQKQKKLPLSLLSSIEKVS